MTDGGIPYAHFYSFRHNLPGAPQLIYLPTYICLLLHHKEELAHDGTQQDTLQCLDFYVVESIYHTVIYPHSC